MNTLDPTTGDIGELVQQAVKEGVSFPRDPSAPDGVQVCLKRNVTDEGRRLVEILRARLDDVNAFHAVRRPKCPNTDDGLPPRLDPDEPDAAIFQIKLEAILFEDRVADFIEQEVAYVRERIVSITEQAFAARRGDTATFSATAKARPRTGQPAPMEFRGGKVVSR